MAAQPKPVKILTEHQQRKSIKGLKKKKSVVKNTLESPFSLDWPSISGAHYTSIGNLLRESCSGLKAMNKPPWKELQKFKKEERKRFLEEYQRKFVENVDGEASQRNKEREEALSHLILGYNAVMRALERDETVAVLAKRNVQPGFLIKTFLPGCANKGVPLVALYGLDTILQSEETLGIGHHCMVLGLKPSVKEPSCRFNQLYVEMCKAVQLDECRMEDDDDDDANGENEVEDEEEEMETEDKENNKENKAIAPAQYPLTEEQVQSYYLKRGNKKERMFIPGQGLKDRKTQSASGESEFISFGTRDDDFPEDTKELQLSLRPTVKKSAKPKEDKKPPKDFPPPEEVDFDSMFLIDDEGDTSNAVEEKTEAVEDIVIKKEVLDDITEETHGKKEVSEEKEKAEPKKAKKAKQGKEEGGETKYHPYVSAKKKRIKNNPNRKQELKSKVKVQR
ncbi:uncharacterized protein LOC122250417 [Penaeus japonicus]|uniref:uncharacterized protein LOC122250417 n=1 Tax=Penaeus japonicus TaxID=27405 RepID=UPI001C7123C9|nr:uncharacterized protein LOC122250417 [Penaeus japonicus]